MRASGCTANLAKYRQVLKHLAEIPSNDIVTAGDALAAAVSDARRSASILPSSGEADDVSTGADARVPKTSLANNVAITAKATPTHADSGVIEAVRRRRPPKILSQLPKEDSNSDSEDGDQVGSNTSSLRHFYQKRDTSSKNSSAVHAGY